MSFYGYYGHGNVRYLSDTNAVVSDTYDYDAFGTLIAQYGSTPNNYLYCGQQFDADLGLYYNRARYLNTDFGRFWTKDLFEGMRLDPWSLHKYSYSHSDPINYSDSSGELEGGAGGQAAISTLGANFEKNLKRIEAKLGQKAIKTTACRIGKIAVEQAVIYIFFDILNEGIYVGRSIEIAERISVHLRNDRLLEQSLVWMFRSRTEAVAALRVLEQNVINAARSVRGIGALANARNEIAEKFWDEMGVCRF